MVIDFLGKIVSVLDVELIYFFMKLKEYKRVVLRSYEKEVFDVENLIFIYYYLLFSLKEKIMLLRLIEIFLSKSSEEICCYVYEGEEFVYVLEGIFIVFLGDE